MMGKGSHDRKMKRLKASGEFKIEWYKPYRAKKAGTCTRCSKGFELDSMVNGDFKWPMHVPCWDAHIAERRPS